MYASARTMSALEPPWVKPRHYEFLGLTVVVVSREVLPLQRDMRQSGSQPRCRWVSIKERIIRVTDLGSKMVRKGN